MYIHTCCWIANGFLLNVLVMVKQLTTHCLSLIYCALYIVSTLQDFHRKLEIEKVDRRLSDSQALQLLEEVREQGKIVRQLREGEAK